MILICPPLPSHLRAFEALAGELEARGHAPTFLIQPGTPLAGNFRSLTLPGEPDHGDPRSFMGQIVAGARRTDRLCRLGPPLLRDAKPSMILGDQTEPAAGLLADALGVPLVSIACALPFEPEPGIPLPFLGWPHDPSEKGLRRNRGGEKVADLLLAPHAFVIRRWSRAWGLGGRSRLQDCLSPLLTLSQTAPGFDYSRPESGRRIAELGPFRRAPEQPFPDDIHPDERRPFIYVSLGTLQGHRKDLLARVARACRAVGAQVLVSHGGRLPPDEASRIPADWVRAFVPQEAVLRRADLCVTHAGLNTALECLANGVPMLALPLAHDQPGVAARIEHCGAGLRLGRTQRGEGRIAVALRRLLEEPGFRRSALRFRERRAEWEGVAGAADRIEAFRRTAAPAPGPGR